MYQIDGNHDQTNQWIPILENSFGIRNILRKISVENIG